MITGYIDVSKLQMPDVSKALTGLGGTINITKHHYETPIRCSNDLSYLSCFGDKGTYCGYQTNLTYHCLYTACHYNKQYLNRSC